MNLSLTSRSGLAEVSAIRWPDPLRLQLNHPKGGCITPLGRLKSAHGSRGEDPVTIALINDYDVGGHCASPTFSRQYQECVGVAATNTNQAVSDLVDTLLKHSSGLWCASTGMDGTRRSGTTASTGTAARRTPAAGYAFVPTARKAEPVTVRVEKLRGWFAPADGEDALWLWLPRYSS